MRVISPIVLTVLLVIVILIYSCSRDKVAELDYCNMLELDQSHIPQDWSDQDAVVKENNIRRDIFKNNFEKLMNYAKAKGFPEMGSLQSSGIDSCRNWTLVLTLFHVG